MDLVMFVVAVLVIGGVGYWLYKTGKGPFSKD